MNNLFWVFLRFVFSLYSLAFYFAFLLAIQIVATTAGREGLSQVQKDMMPYGMALQIIAIVLSIACAISGKYKFGKEIIRKKEGYIFYYKTNPFAMQIVFIGMLIITTWSTIMLCAGDVTKKVFFSIYLWAGPIGIVILMSYLTIIAKWWSVIYASDINNLTVKFAKFSFIPWTTNINPGEIKEVIFKTMILETGSKTSSDAKLKEIKDEIDELAKGLAVQAVDMVDFVEKTKKMYPGMAIIIERIVLKSVSGSSTSIILGEKSDFKSFVKILFKGRKPMIIWKSSMMYGNSF